MVNSGSKSNRITHIGVLKYFGSSFMHYTNTFLIVKLHSLTWLNYNTETNENKVFLPSIAEKQNQLKPLILKIYFFSVYSTN